MFQESCSLLRFRTIFFNFGSFTLTGAQFSHHAFGNLLGRLLVAWACLSCFSIVVFHNLDFECACSGCRAPEHAHSLCRDPRMSFLFAVQNAQQLSSSPLFFFVTLPCTETDDFQRVTSSRVFSLPRYTDNYKCVYLEFPYLKHDFRGLCVGNVNHAYNLPLP